MANGAAAAAAAACADYAGSFKYDLFISYAHGPRGPSGRGPLQSWSRQFRDLLEVNLRFYGLDPARIFFDDSPRLDERLDPLSPLEVQFAEELAASAMLQVHVSNKYLDSDWCKHELAAWMGCLATKPGGVDRRISVVRVGDTGDVGWPEPLAPGGTQLPGTRFHDEGSLVPWGFNLDWGGNAPSPAFSAELITTAAFLHKRIEELRADLKRKAAEVAQVQALEAGTAGVKSIYLHGRAREKDLWQRTADELTALDVEVQPMNPAPNEDEGDAWESLSKIASRCEAMLLVSNDPFELNADLDVIGRDRRNYIQARFRKFLPCAVVDRAGLGTERFVKAARLRGIDWLDARTSGWGDSFRGWLGGSAQVAAAKYGLQAGP